MRVAALYDIHGNPAALEAVLADAARHSPDVYLIGGDVVAGPMPRETLARLEREGPRVRYIRGNTEREVWDAFVNGPDPSKPWGLAMRWVGEQLGRATLERLMAQPSTTEIEIDGIGRTLFCHGSPRDDNEILTRVSSEDRVREALGGVTASLVVGGHTHVQYERTVGRQRMVNAGSVGMPYEDTPGARWALLGPDVTLMRTEYDLERAADTIRATAYPDAAGFVEKYLLHPFSAQQASEFFEGMALRAQGA